MSSRLPETSINCRDANALTQWWKPVLGYTDMPGDPNEPGDEECIIVAPSTGQRLLIIEVEDLQEARAESTSIASTIEQLAAGQKR